MQIKTLDQILAETEDRPCPSRVNNKNLHKSNTSAVDDAAAITCNAKLYTHLTLNKRNSSFSKRQTNNRQDNRQHSGAPTPDSKYKKNKRKNFHPASPFQSKIIKPSPIKELDNNSIKSLLAQVNAESNNPTLASVMNSSTNASSLNNTTNDNVPSALKAYLKTPEQRQAELEEIKANSRLRWLAFYYLSRREHSAAELKQKLVNKEQDPDKIDTLLSEFSEKGYQSDHRTAMMLIREGIRKKRGRTRIKQDFYQRQVAVPDNIDALIHMAMQDSEELADLVTDNALMHGVDWLKLAVEARVKKYGNYLPNSPKDKARQLRFLQYRGFKPDICFDALKYTIAMLEERF